MESSETETGERVLVSGASFAGLASAIWMRRLGYEVTIVEVGPGLKRGGTPVDIRDESIELVDRMGLLESIRAKALPPRATEFANAAGGVDARMDPEPADSSGIVDGYEIHRDELLDILFDALDDGVEVLFGDSIASLVDIPGGVHVEFRHGRPCDFAMVLGCDGNHSVVRRLRFGPESDFSHFLHNYFTVAIVGETFIDPSTTRILNTPGRTLMLNSYENSTDIVLTFHADEEIAYDYHDAEEQKRILRERFADAGPQFAELVEKAESADTFYFDKLSQIRMPNWAAGRVVLVGDAGYCASPAAGMGGSLAIMGATALFDALGSAAGDVDAAFADYERSFRPVVERIQSEAENVGVPTYFPETSEAIQRRNEMFAGH